MNKSHRIALLCCASLPFLAQAQTAQIHIAGNAYPIEFADTTLSATNKYRIASDLTLIFSLASSFEEARGGGGHEIEEGVFEPNTDVAMFCFSEWGEDFLLVDQNNQRSIRVKKTGSDRYLRSFALMKTHSNAVHKAREFVTMLNTTDLSTQPIQEVRGLIHAKLWSEENISDNSLREGIAELQKFKCIEISALNLFLQRVSKADNAEVLVLGLYMADKTNPSPENRRAWTFDFYNGKWGLGRTPLELDRAELVE